MIVEALETTFPVELNADRDRRPGADRRRNASREALNPVSTCTGPFLVVRGQFWPTLFSQTRTFGASLAASCLLGQKVSCEFTAHYSEDRFVKLIELDE